MHRLRPRAIALFVLLLAPALGLVACGSKGDQPTVTTVNTLTYAAGVYPPVHVSDDGVQKNVRVEHIEYATVDGQTVPAMFSIPTDRAPLGCLMYQPGYGTPKEQAAAVHAGAATLGLATFTIDPRNVGARGSAEEALAAIKNPDALAEMLQNTAVDLRVGLDYLETRPECQHNIAYMGTSFGAVVGAILSGQDHRIRATVLTSVGATFKRGIVLNNRAAERDPSFQAAIAPASIGDPAAFKHAVSVLSPYDPERWVGKIAPRPLMLINGRNDPLVSPTDARNIAHAARQPKTVLEIDSGHDPFQAGPAQRAVTDRVANFLSQNLDLEAP